MPTRSTVGPEAARQFVTMVQHQPPELRRAVLPKLRENVDRGEADPGDYAMMFDRAQVDDGTLQRYGATSRASLTARSSRRRLQMRSTSTCAVRSSASSRCASTRDYSGNPCLRTSARRSRRRQSANSTLFSSFRI